MIEFKDISKNYTETIAALHDINLDIEERDFLFITGPSGAGKSTLVRLLIREEKPTKGEIFFEDIDVVRLPNKLLPVYRQQIGIAFQDLKLLESRTARDNIKFTLEIVNKPREQITSTAEYLLDLVNLKDRADLLPCQLSGGERQKIAIARALATEPKILIADEPTGNLDPKSTAEIMDILKTINDINTTVLVITHDQDVVKNIPSRVIILEKGRILSDTKNKKAKVKKSKDGEKTKPKEEKKKDLDNLNKVKKTDIKKEEKKNEIELLKLPKKLEKKLLDNKIDSLEKLIDLTESKLKKYGIEKEELEKIANKIMKINNLDK